MNNLKLTSSYEDNALSGVGSARLRGDQITVNLDLGSSATILRGINKIVLLKSDSLERSVYGRVVIGDVYILDNGEERLTIKVEEEETKHENPIFVNNDPISEKKKSTLTVGVLILILLIFSVVFGVIQKNKREFVKKSESELLLAISSYEKSVSESSVDRTSSREAFVLAKETALKLKETGYKSKSLEKLISDILSKEAEVLGEVKVELKELLDLTLQINAFNGEKMVSTGEIMFIWDKNNKSMVRVNTDGKDAKIVAGKDNLSEVLDIAAYEDRLFSLNNDGTYELTDKKEKINDQTGSYFYLYSANIYLLDRDVNQIFRFAGNGKTFAEKTDWLAPGIEVDFSKVIDLTIDGSIWLLSSSGKVTKFTNGNPTVVLMKGIVEELVNPTAIYTNEKLKYVYILDKEDGRVIVLEKNLPAQAGGDFKVQYVGDSIKEAKDLIVSEEEGKIILLTGNKLMYIPI